MRTNSRARLARRSPAGFVDLTEEKARRPESEYGKAFARIQGLVRHYTHVMPRGHPGVSVARMRSPEGWQEPGQRPEFEEITVVLRGTLRVEYEGGVLDVGEEQAVITAPGEWVRYSTPFAGGAEYIAVCLPAFSIDTVHRDS